MKQKQSGFSAIEAIIIVVVVVILGFGGWYVWNTKKDDDKKSQNTSENTPNNTVKLTTKLTSHNDVFSLQLPDGWKVTNDTTLDYAQAIGQENTLYKAGTPATVTVAAMPGGDGPTSTSFTINGGSASDFANYFVNRADDESFKTTSGVEGKKHVTVAKETDDSATPGTKTYSYKFTKGDKAVVVYYIESPGAPDQLSIVEDSLKTLQIQ